MSQLHTHYENLFVARNAPIEVIRAAYKALAQKYHPDRNKSQDAERVMKLINEAWNVLSDLKLRREHDEYIERTNKPNAPQTPTSARTSERASKRPADPPSKQSSEGSKSLLEELEALAVQLWFKNHSHEYVLSYLKSRGLPESQAHAIANKVFH